MIDKPKKESPDEAIDHQAILKDIHTRALGGFPKRALARIDRYTARVGALRGQPEWLDTKVAADKEKLLMLLDGYSRDQRRQVEAIYSAAIYHLKESGGPHLRWPQYHQP